MGLVFLVYEVVVWVEDYWVVLEVGWFVEVGDWFGGWVGVEVVWFWL